jgi:hypothetical protein
MINPKQNLTSLKSLYLATHSAEPARRFLPEFAAALAEADTVHENEQTAFLAMQELYSISTIEEVAAIAHIDTGAKTSLIKSLGLSAAAAKRILKSFRDHPLGKQTLEEWERFQQYEYQLGCDLDLDAPPVSDLSLAVGAPPPAAPPTPSVNLISDCMPPIRHQQSRGTCVAFTSVAALEYYFCKFRGEPGLDLSEQFEFWNMVSHTNRCTLRDGFPLLQTSGVCRDNTWPYNPVRGPSPDDQGPPPATALAEAPAFSCNTVRQLQNPRAVPEIQQALQRSRVVGIGIPVYNSWYLSGAVRLDGNITVPLPGEVALQTGHAVALVGYADDSQFAGGGYFIVRNSWGNTWAPRSVFGPGYGTIPYRYISNFNWDAWCIIS